MSIRVLNYAIIIVSVILITAILLQVRGSGLGSMFGGSGGDSFRSKRGLEKMFYYLTIIFAIILVTLCIVWGLYSGATINP